MQDDWKLWSQFSFYLPSVRPRHCTGIAKEPKLDLKKLCIRAKPKWMREIWLHHGEDAERRRAIRTPRPLRRKYMLRRGGQNTLYLPGYDSFTYDAAEETCLFERFVQRRLTRERADSK